MQELIEFLRGHGFGQMEEIELVDEDVRFSLPVGADGLRSDERFGTSDGAIWNGRRAGYAAGGRVLAGLQRRDGHWCARLTADTTLESDYILFQLWLHPPQDGRWEPPTAPLVEKAVQSILARQLRRRRIQYLRRGPCEVSASVKAYVALKLAGRAPDDPRMERLRRRILELGGIQAANSYVKINLSLFGLYPRRVLPQHSAGSGAAAVRLLYQMSSWTRAIVVSLAIVHAADPRRPAPEGFTLDEIWLPGVSPAFRRRRAALHGTIFSWRATGC